MSKKKSKEKKGGNPYGHLKRPYFLQKTQQKKNNFQKAPSPRTLLQFMPPSWQKDWSNKTREELLYEQFEKQKKEKEKKLQNQKNPRKSQSRHYKKKSS